MKKSSTTQRKPTPFFIAFLVIALLFLAFGLGTLGSFETVGDSFELRAPVTAPGTQEEQTSEVVMYLSSVSEKHTDKNGNETTEDLRLAMDDIYLYVDSIYSPAGTPVTVTIRYSSSTTFTSSTRLMTATLENLYTPETAEDLPANYQTDALYRWVHPFTLPASTWQISTYHRAQITVTGANVRIGEILFVGRPTIEGANQSRYIIPARVESATITLNETPEQAVERAGALLDCKANKQAYAYVSPAEGEEVSIPGEDMIPTDATTSYSAFTKAEIYSLLTITEMRLGGAASTVKGTGSSEYDPNVYHAESVYNTLGMDLVALGTKMFGVSPFGLRFMPMLFSFGILVLGFFFAKRLFKSDRAGFIFTVLYALCDLSFSLGHVGTPLTAGIFFLLLAAYCVDSFYRRGIKKVGVLGLAPLLFGGLSAAAAICVNGAMLIPVIGVCVLYVAAMIRQQKANKYYLDKAVEECEAAGNGAAEKKQVAKVMSENRYRNLAAGILFPVALVLGAVVFSLLFLLPVYVPLLKVYDTGLTYADGNANPTMNIFALGWKAFLGGFVGENVIGNMPSDWSIFYRLFAGAGESYAVTAAVINAVAAVCGLIGVVYAICKIVVAVKDLPAQGKELRRVVPLLAGLVLSLITASFGGGALGFIFMAYIFSFLLAAYAADDTMNREGTAGKAAKAVTITALVLTLVCFALFAVFTFSVPLPASFMGKFI